ncbi:MAG TPA: hypothetical protein VD927_00850 [Chryseosolibacter sp.]|nr:hypothetical protein [Chryseosolibacter sp.]
MKTKLVFAFLLIAAAGNAQNFLSKTVAKLAKGMGQSTNVETTANLDETTPLVIIESNLHPKQVGTISQTFFDGWVPGGDMAFVMFSSKKNMSYTKLDGTVMIDGVPVEYQTAGMYTLTTTPVTAARKIEIITSSRQTSSFTVTPFLTPPFKIKSINGETNNPSVDLTKDVTIEIDPLDLPANSLLKVSIAINQVSIKSFYEVAFVRSGSTITIPANAFRNINIKPAGDAVYNYKKSYIAVHYETTEEATNVTGAFASVPYVRSYSDGMFVNVTGEPTLNPGLSVNGSVDDFKFEAFKAHAFLARPFSHIKNVGLISFALRGTSYQEVTQTASTGPVRMNPFGGASSTTTVATITITRELPWQGVLDELYPEFMAVLESEFGASSVGVNNITSSPSYAVINETSYNDPYTKVEFAKTYRDTKVVSAFMPFSEGYGANSVYQKIMNETRTDALVSLTLDLQLSQEDGTSRMLLIPRLGFEITGKANGRTVLTKYASGVVESTVASGFEKDVTAAELVSLIRKTEMMNAFRKALKELKASEQSNGDYEVVWNLQK